MSRQYNLDDSLYLRLTPERHTVIKMAFEKCGSYRYFGKQLGITSTPVKNILNGTTKHITVDRYEKVRLIVLHGFG